MTDLPRLAGWWVGQPPKPRLADPSVTGVSLHGVALHRPALGPDCDDAVALEPEPGHARALDYAHAQVVGGPPESVIAALQDPCPEPVYPRPRPQKP